MIPMPKFIRTLSFFFLCLCSLLSASAYAGSQDPLEADHIVAVVGDEVITYRELHKRLDAALVQLQKQGTPLPSQDVLERQMLERVIMDRAQLQYAKETGLTIDDNQLDQAIGRIAANNKMTLSQFREALEKDHIQYANFREEIRGEMLTVRLREREVDSKLVISDGEIDNYLANQNATGVGAGEEFQLAHILLRAPESASPEQLQKLRLRGEKALKQARAGENFAQLTATFSDAPDALKGGDLGWRSLDRMPALYADTVSRLQPGEVSELLRSSAGFHIVKLIDKRGGGAPASVQQTHARHILVRVNEIVSEADARHKLETVRERIMNGLDFAEQARLYSQDGSAAKGGDLGWLNPGDTVPDFAQAMDALKIGETSPVVKSPFGMHLIQVLERRERDVSVERQRALARQALRERKLDDAYQDWLRQLRDRTYVENRLLEQ
jgi:peptidyl-prolyl cis-trans isomerase SurA